MTHRDTADERNRRNNGPQRPEVRPTRNMQDQRPRTVEPPKLPSSTRQADRSSTASYRVRPAGQTVPTSPARGRTRDPRHAAQPQAESSRSLRLPLAGKMKADESNAGTTFSQRISERVAQASYGPGSSGRFGTAGGAGTVHSETAGASARKPRKKNFITRSVEHWCNRLLGAVSDRSLADQEAEYASHRTTRDFIFNALGTGLWGLSFPLLSIVATQLVGVEQAGMFSMAFVTALVLMIVANYGVRTYQCSDLNQEHTFTEYQINRLITCLVMLLAGVGYCYFRGYDEHMFTICMGVYFYKMIDGLADVYEGRLQQMDKLYLAGISQAARSALAVIVFSAVLFITHDLAVSCIAMAIAAAVSFVFLTYPLALFETPKSKGWQLNSLAALFKECFPLFLALFLYNLIDNMPKFVMEGVLSYDNQLYFNAIYFPAHGLLLMSQLIYRPLLVRMAAVWADPEKRLRFDIIIVVILLVVVGLTLAMAAIMGTVGIPVLGMLYGVDFEQFRGLVYIMLAAGGLTAAIDFIYQTITILRRQMAVMKLYLITFGFSLFVPVLLVNFTGLPGAVIGYLIVMCILFMLLIWEYGKIRLQLMREDKKKAQEELVRRRHDSTKIHPIKG